MPYAGPARGTIPGRVVAGRGWTPAHAIEPGNRLVTLDGITVVKVIEDDERL